MSRALLWDPEDGRIVAAFPFDFQLKEYVKSLSGARFCGKTKTWRFPPESRDEVVGALVAFGFENRLPDELHGATVAVDSLSVSGLNNLIARALSQSLAASYQVEGVLTGYDRNRRRSPQGGSSTLYARLSEHAPDGRLLASISLVFFAEALERIEKRLDEVGLELREELPIRLRGRVNYWSPRGSLSFAVEDIDPEFSLGDLQRRQDQVFRQLHAEGLLELQAALPVPVLPRRIAILTSVGSDAWHDVLSSLQKAGWPIEITPYAVRVQGADLRPTVLAALAHIQQGPLPDLVLITRGGGSRVDLADWDDLEVARAVARLPAKVLVAIGHEQDRSVLDMFALSAKTPTAAGEWIVEQWEGAVQRIRDVGEKIERSVRRRIAHEEELHGGLAHRIEWAAKARIRREMARVDAVTPRLAHALRFRVRQERSLLEQLGPRLENLVRGASLARRREQLVNLERRLAQGSARIVQREQQVLSALGDRIRLVHPDTILARGFAWIRDAQGQLRTTAASLSPGARLTLTLRDGTADVEVKNIKLETE